MADLKNNLTHIWFMEFGLIEFIFSVIARSKGPVRIFADSTNLVASICARIINIKIEPYYYSQSVEDPEGRNIRFRAEELKAIIRNGLQRDSGNFDWLPEEERAYGPEWHRLLASHLFLESVFAGDFVAFIENAYRLSLVEGDNPTKIIAFIGRHILARHMRSLSLATKTPTAIRLAAYGDSLFPLFLKQAEQQIWRLFYLLKRQIRPAMTQTNIKSTNLGNVLIQYEKGMLDRSPMGATYDWIEHSTIDHERIIFYFSRVDSPLTDEVKKELSSRGFGWADYYRPENYFDRPLRAGLTSLYKLLCQLGHIRDHYSAWRWSIIASSLFRVRSHRNFIRKYNIVAVNQHNEFVPFQMALNLACRQEGAMFVWTLWSVLVFIVSWYDHAMADLILTSGDYDLGHNNVLSFDYRYAVKTGLIGNDGTEDGDQEQARLIRAQLTAKPRFVVALFDSSHTKRSAHHSTERCALFFRIMLTLVLETPDWGCLIKSKSMDLSVFSDYPELQQMVETLQAQGRALFLPHTVKPSLAAWAADAAVCYAVNSAGFLAGLLTDRPVLHFDQNHLSTHPISVAGGDGSIIFRDEQSFIAALMSVARGERVFGDLTPWKGLFDPFLDGMGRKRSAKVISDYITARDEGLSMEQALRLAAERHAETYGDDFVITRQEPHETPGDLLWQKTERLHYPDRPPPIPYTQATLATPPIRKVKPAKPT